MSLRTIIVAISCGCAVLSGCSKKTEAELAEAERVKIREEKRAAAAKAYKDLADNFPEDKNARAAAAKAKELSAPPKK
jgi:hypothetical protein